jgi:hypothetical protein
LINHFYFIVTKIWLLEISIKKDYLTIIIKLIS